MHARHRVAHRHGIPCIPVIARTDSHKIILLRLSLAIPVLHGHFQGHLHCHRARVGIEYLLHGRWDKRQQQLAQFNGRVVCQSSEHHMRHLAQLFLCRPVQCRVVVPVDGTPPRRHSLYERFSAFQGDGGAFGMLHLVHRQRVGCGGIGVP